MELIAPYLAACVLLVFAGSAKALRPGDTARAVSGVIPVPIRGAVPAVRVGAVVEVVVGVAGFVRPSPLTAGLVAASYVGFAVFVAVALARGGPLATCGCFAKPDTPATRLHVAVDAGLACSALIVAAVVPASTLPALLATQPTRGIPLVFLAVLGTWLVYLALGPMAGLGAARRRLGIVRNGA